MGQQSDRFTLASLRALPRVIITGALSLCLRLLNPSLPPSQAPTAWSLPAPQTLQKRLRPQGFCTSCLLLSPEKSSFPLLPRLLHGNLRPSGLASSRQPSEHPN